MKILNLEKLNEKKIRDNKNIKINQLNIKLNNKIKLSSKIRIYIYIHVYIDLYTDENLYF